MLELIEMAADLGNAVVKRLNALIGACLHYRAFHHGQDKAGKLAQVTVPGQALFGLEQEFFHRACPPGKVSGNFVVNHAAIRLDLQSEPANRTAEGELSGDDVLPVLLEQQENAFDGIPRLLEDRLKQDRPQILLVPIQNCEKQVFLTGEKEIEAAAVGIGLFEDLRHACAGISMGVEKLNGGLDDAVA